jgi:Uma2 family endonuclease
MNVNTTIPPPPVVYLEFDGQLLSDNTRQLRWITTLFGNLAALFGERPDVFVAAELWWYPVEGQPEVRTAPDVLVVFGRPKGDRGTYKQWEESNVPPTVVFEVLSPSTTWMELDDMLAFCEEHGVEEFYAYDPDHNRLMAFVRQDDVLRRVRPGQGYVSPRLGIRFDVSGDELVVYRPDGQRFLTFPEQEAARREAEQRAARLAELSRKARRGQASAEELRELDRREEPPTAATP